MSKYHIPVLLEEVLEGLQIKKGEKYIDATLGGGGHTKEILERGGLVLGLDVDQDALEYVTQELRIKNQELKIAQGNFRDIDRLAKANGFENVAGILFDFGVSSFQLDNAEKGFSFLRDGPLDMRMDKTLSVSAKELVNGLGRGELADLFLKLGEDRNAKKVAQAIVIERQFKKIETTLDLVRVIEKGYGVTNEVLSEKRKVEISMRIFQALRMAVNDELGVIEEGLRKSIGLLKENGRLAVISFHSLEDRVVKQTFVEWEKRGKGKNITKKPIIATEQEAKENRRSRSAKLRVFEKI